MTKITHYFFRISPRFANLLVAICLSGALPTFADEAAERYKQIHPSRDGIGKTYMGREIAQVMGWQGAQWLEREEREQEERGDLLLRELGLKPGMNVMDVGAGTGYYSRRMATMVGPKGIVFAIDVQPEMIKALEQGRRAP